MSKQPTPKEIRERLSAGHFGKSRKVPPGDPVQTTPMVVPVTKIDLYDHNPRAVTNEKYEDIKESIRTSGLEQPLSITRRPGAENYMVDAGGNTRLKILKELHQQYPDDPRFFNINVLYQPWESEAHVLAKHLKENDLRGSLTFIDRARGIAKMREFLERGREKPLSYRELSQALKEEGYSIHAGRLSLLEYTHNTLLPLIPLSLEAGLGQPQVEKIRRIEKVLLKYLAFLEYADQEGPLALWHECLAEVDTSEGPLPIDTAYEQLARRLEPLLQYANAQSILIDLDMLQEGKTLTRYEPPPELLDGGEDEASSGGEASSTGKATEPPRQTTPKTTPPGGIVGTTGGYEDSNTSQATREATDTSPASALSASGDAQSAEAPRQPTPPGGELPSDSAPARPAASEKPLPDDIKSLRGRLWTQAMRLAQPAGLSDLILRTTGGAGYWIDLPEEPLAQWVGGGNPLGKTRQQRQRMAIWWMLMELAEQSMAVLPPRGDPPAVMAPEELVKTRWAIYLAENGGKDGIERYIGVPQFHMGIALRNLENRELQLLIDMLQAKEKLARMLGRPDSLWVPELKWPDSEEDETFEEDLEDDSEINYDDGPWEDPWRIE